MKLNYTIFEWPQGTRMVRYLDKVNLGVVTGAGVKPESRRSSGIFFGIGDVVWLGFENDNVPRKYQSQALIQIGFVNGTPDIFGIRIIATRFLHPEVLDAMRWVAFEELGLEKTLNPSVESMSSRDQNLLHEILWALHLPKKVSDKAFYAAKTIPEWEHLNVALQAMRLIADTVILDEEEEQRLNTDFPVEHESHEPIYEPHSPSYHMLLLQDASENVRYSVTRLLGRISNIFTDLEAERSGILYSDSIRVPVILIIGGDDNIDPKLNIWRVDLDEGVSGSLKISEYALFDPKYKESKNAESELVWRNRAGKAVPILEGIYRGGDLLDFLEYLGIFVPESRYEAWLDENMTEPSERTLPGEDSVYFALGLLPPWLWKRDKLREFLGMRPAG